MSKNNPPRCLWCDVRLAPTPGRRSERRFCSDAHRAKYKRTQRDETTAEIVQRLEPYVNEAGVFIFQELIDHLAVKVNAEV